MASPNPLNGWIPPEPGSIKVNMDGALPDASEVGSIACLCCDHNGTLLNGYAQNVQASSPLQTETLALLSTLQFLLRQDFGNTHLILESDCLELVETVNHRKRPSQVCQSSLEHAATLLRECPNFLLQHCRREANLAADWIAKAQG
ncbi:uncharacterized protein LOC120293901 [Eucalyptus grandis]|uniref:uncharacterized protein LOC120293901 n=1 Tax=Eucalyptus grandis TaxID=71139 RepID=UPI00192F00A2|nr:uncharacterized protein LOC120293901 [Eucalyptus grandis]